MASYEDACQWTADNEDALWTSVRRQYFQEGLHQGLDLPEAEALADEKTIGLFLKMQLS